MACTYREGYGYYRCQPSRDADAYHRGIHAVSGYADAWNIAVLVRANQPHDQRHAHTLRQRWSSGHAVLHRRGPDNRTGGTVKQKMTNVKDLLLDKFVFNYIIMILYALNSLRFGLSGLWGDMFYWMGALWITLAITFGYNR